MNISNNEYIRNYPIDVRMKIIHIILLYNILILIILIYLILLSSLF